MSIRLKLLLSYAAMLVIPLFIMIITAGLLIVVFRGDVQSVRDQYVSSGGLFENHNVERMVKEIKRTAENNPAALMDSAYLADIDQELQMNKSGLIVRKADQIAYVSPSLQQSDILAHLPIFDRPGHIEKEDAKRYGNQMLETIHLDVMFTNHQPGTIIVATTVNPLVNFAQKFFPILFITLIVILITTHTLLTYFVSRSIIRPLQELKQAMKRMKAGDLDFQVQVTNKDEIGQLSLAFDQMRKQLQESIQTQLLYEENRKELVSNISHDLRTPLTAIRGYVDGIGDGIADTPEKRQKYIDIISSKAEEMDHLIDELFLYSKLDLKRLPFNYEIVDLFAFMQDWSDELDFELGKQGVHFSTQLSIEPRMKISIDRDKMRRVFTNIMDNCLKYMNKSDKRIELEAHTSENNLVIEIKDNGQGIAAEALPHIFERFYRADPSRNSLTGGSGLGLAISKQIIEGHEGTIQATSVKGEWTVIRIVLPLRMNKVGDDL
ncbi:HAMP domain-containing sensor histidine kinase [Paenibacillus sp. N3.4]|uniref:sensor histidine kinase n=1 Tax=Paenibacillus sp. N3.4 TaxID=2603222 RepID=UPI0011CCC70D|nr:HAMP domain-containing sensor histidine kinase [Paenibacillus sp. N3.4]TXK76967.1 cell wall metabolism sensor histidine kinase WalK [Paenibacillus sp. N3.4]